MNYSLCLKVIMEGYRRHNPNDLADNIGTYFQNRSVHMVRHTDVVLLYTVFPDFASIFLKGIRFLLSYNHRSLNILYILGWRSMHWFELLLWNRLFSKMLFQQLTSSVGQSPFWVTNSSSPSQESSCILWNLKVHHHIHKSSPHILRQIKYMPSHSIHWRSILILPSYLCLGLPTGLFPLWFPTKTL